LPEPAGRWVVLLRAVNVAGTTLRMAAFRGVLASAGCDRVETVGASGNAVVSPPPRATPAGLEVSVEDALGPRGGLRVEAFVRTAAEWHRLVARNPYVAQATTDPGHLLVTVLKDTPAAGAWAALAGAIVGRESVSPAGRHGYFVYPDGIGRSKLTPAVIERHLGTRGTARNWNTVLRLELLTNAGGPVASGTPRSAGPGPREG
jgi:uncharacterized protein (DUF1697 family)